MRHLGITLVFAVVICCCPALVPAATVEFLIELDGAQAGTASPATGAGTATLDTETNTLEWEIAFDESALVDGLGSVTVAHFHRGAPGVSGPVLSPPGDVSGDGTSPMVDAAVLDDAHVADFLAGAVYFNIHTTAFPPGEIRGQVVPERALLAAAKDNTLYENAAGARSNGSGAHFFVGRTQNGNPRRGLIQFDLAGSGIPTGSTILSAVLSLNMSRTRAGSETVALRRVVRDWGEGTSNASGNEGGGASAANGDATWAHTFFPDQPWDSPGGDFLDTASAETAVASQARYEWGPSESMTADAQDWLDRPETDFGWLLLGNEGRNQTAKRFDSRQNAATANRPLLEIRYRAPCLFDLPGDVNSDCTVDFLDFAIMASNWLTDCQTLPLDPACIPK
jgi:hypothetical protein